MAQLAIFARSGYEYDGVEELSVEQHRDKQEGDPGACTWFLKINTAKDHVTIFLNEESLEVLCRGINTAASATLDHPQAQLVP